MKRLFFALLLLLPGGMGWNAYGQATPVAATPDPEIEALLSRMTLEEKAGQMTNIGLMALCEGDFYGGRDTIRLDPAKVRKLLVEHHIGSVQNMGKYPLTTEEWRYFIGELQEVAGRDTRLGIPLLYAIDAVHGANYTAGSTLFPHQLGLAATWNPALAEATGRITAYEAKASGIPWVFGPSLDVARQPLWGRISETFGEDTYLTQVMGLAIQKGAQGDDFSAPFRAAVCAKHFIGYGTPLNGKDRSPAYLPEPLLRQVYLPPFAAAVKAGLPAVMLNSGSINGIPSHIDHFLITELLKGELGFPGVVISDWGDITSLVEVHRVARDEKEAIRLAVNAGMDLCMEPYDESFSVNLVELVEEGAIPMERIDDAVRRVLQFKKHLGLFAQTMYPSDRYDEFGSKDFARESLRAARESLTLLKNEEGTLPLPKTGKVLVTGVAAHSLNYLNGAWSRTFLGRDTAYNDPGKQTILEAIRTKIGKDRVIYAPGTDFDQPVDLEAAVAATAGVDYIIACLGERPATEKPSDIEDLALPAAQRDLVKALAATGKPVILVLLEGRPRLISDIVPAASGILLAYYPGNEGGRAVADVLFGDFNPSGKLPYTYPRHSGSIWTYDHLRSDERDPNWGFDGYQPQWSFGEGLSYTEFSYQNLALSRSALTSEETLTISVDVANTGDRAGQEVVQLYLTDLVASISPPVRQLKRFEKIFLEAGARKTVRFTLTQKDLAFVNRQNEWIAEAGDFRVMIGDEQATFTLLKGTR